MWLVAQKRTQVWLVAWKKQRQSIATRRKNAQQCTKKQHDAAQNAQHYAKTQHSAKTHRKNATRRKKQRKNATRRKNYRRSHRTGCTGPDPPTFEKVKLDPPQLSRADPPRTRPIFYPKLLNFVVRIIVIQTFLKKQMTYSPTLIIINIIIMITTTLSIVYKFTTHHAHSIKRTQISSFYYKFYAISFSKFPGKIFVC